ncbi:citrate synthase [Williamsia deligens]|uniref:citrate synthase (unknown stereospecificity) n=1 Tax=Williamsia deligens TaxID=321325 RepID=A0ABW3G355_9NOCA|nr:citrate synthase [Williamsia deligens]MCP2194615.1 citrate synthase [Williamsia deligens]
MTRRHTRRWPEALHLDGRAYLTTAQTARVLGVRPATLYAYVSRGLLTSVRIEGMRGTLYAVAEVEAFARRTERRPPAGIVERIRTELTLIEDDELWYRGRRASDLAWDRDVTDVAALLWDTPWPAVRPSPVTVPAGRRGLDVIRLVVDELGARDPDRQGTSTEERVWAAARIIESAVESMPLVGPAAARDAALARRLWPRLSPMAATPKRVALLNAALVLLADHDLSAGAVAARVAASSRGGVHAVVSAGLGAFDGPLHGGATAAAQQFVAETVECGSDAATVLSTRDGLPGCGHVVYRTRDPRAEALFGALESEGMPAGLSVAVGAIRAEASARSSPATSDLALAAIALRYRMVPDAATTVFALARIVGWVAHALEEYCEAPLRFRPEGVYVGIRPT